LPVAENAYLVANTRCLEFLRSGNIRRQQRLLFDTVRNGDVRKVRAALSQGIDANGVTTLAQTPLILAATLGSVEIVHLLLDRHASINAKDENGVTALMAASTSGHFAVVCELLKRGADINSTNSAGMNTRARGDNE